MSVLEELTHHFRTRLIELVDLSARERRNIGFLLAVSGGADSIALLRLFDHERRRSDSPLRRSRVAMGHVDHGLRDDAGEQDAAFVESLARELELEFRTARLDVRQHAANTGQSLETAARQLRYETLARWARELGLDHVVTAHHLDDQRETVLFRIARGAGWRGLAGIPASRPLNDASGREVARLLRPLLEVERITLRALLHELGQRYRDDATNMDLGMSRNALRHEVLPALLTQVHPGAEQSLDRLARRARQTLTDLELWLQERWAALRAAERDSTRQLALVTAELARLPASLWPLAVERATNEVCASLPDTPAPRLSERRLESLRSLATDASRGGGGGAIAMGSGWEARVDGSHTVLAAPPRTAAPPPPGDLDLPLDGEVLWGRWEVALCDGSRQPVVFTTDPDVELVDLQRLCGPLTVSAARSADRFWPLGAPGHKRLGEFLRERGVEATERPARPVVRCGEAIVWVVGLGLGHPFRVTETTERVGELRARRRAP